MFYWSFIGGFIGILEISCNKKY